MILLSIPVGKQELCLERDMLLHKRRDKVLTANCEQKTLFGANQSLEISCRRSLDNTNQIILSKRRSNPVSGVSYATRNSFDNIRTKINQKKLTGPISCFSDHNIAIKAFESQIENVSDKHSIAELINESFDSNSVASLSIDLGIHSMIKTERDYEEAYLATLINDAAFNKKDLLSSKPSSSTIPRIIGKSSHYKMKKCKSSNSI
jgi:hypothetical protein